MDKILNAIEKALKTVGFWLVLLFIGGGACMINTCDADVLDDLSNSTFSGYVARNDLNESYIENVTILEPTFGDVFGVAVKKIQYTVTFFGNDVILDDILAIGSIGVSDTFFPSYRKLDEPFDESAYGGIYDGLRHWMGEDAPPVYLGVYFREGGNLLYTLMGQVYLNDFFGESTNGYYMKFDILMGMESALNREYLDGRVAFGKDFEPDGSSYGEVFLENRSGWSYYGAGAGFRF
jgi:hypothetical protein